MSRPDATKGVMKIGESWKDRAEELAADLADAEERLQQIADIAAPERMLADERLDWIEEALAALIGNLAGDELEPETRRAAFNELLNRRPPRE